MMILLILICLILPGCSVFTRETDEATILVACPDLEVPADKSFGATTLALSRNGKTYYECRCAAAPSTCPKD